MIDFAERVDYMREDEIDSIPSGILTSFVDDEEAGVYSISDSTIVLRLPYAIQGAAHIKVYFYSFRDDRYEEYDAGKVMHISEEICQFYYLYRYEIVDNTFKKCVDNMLYEYSRYIRLKSESIDNYYSKELTGYRSDEDEIYPESYEKGIEELMRAVDTTALIDVVSENWNVAVSIDNYVAYKRLLESGVRKYCAEYVNHYLSIEATTLIDKIDRIYIGNEYCHNLMPDDELLLELINMAYKEKYQITVVTTYLRDYLIEKMRATATKLYEWTVLRDTHIEVVINDYGMIEIFRGMEERIVLSYGTLLNKMRRDPRYVYKRGGDRYLLTEQENSLNVPDYQEHLENMNVKRYEYESFYGKIKTASSASSLHLPFYQTNTSQFCPLYAICKNGDRGKQVLVKKCERYCNNYVVAYASHLKLFLRYNSICGFNDRIFEDIKKYREDDISRIVLNF